MSQEKGSQHENDEAVRYGQWVQEHARIDDSGFPAYPDEPSRRGSSPGAVPNGNSWRSVDADENPGRPGGDENTVPMPRSEPVVADNGAAQALGEPTHRPAIVSAENEADERIGRDVGDVLATSKLLDGIHLLVEVVDGDVYLHGTVADQAVRGEVERLASSVSGTNRIYNELDVRT
jgi:hypothetical protein